MQLAFSTARLMGTLFGLNLGSEFCPHLRTYLRLRPAIPSGPFFFQRRLNKRKRPIQTNRPARRLVQALASS